ncbi:MAG: DUF4422 domain-containing protein [Alphaproteobacteria bacterium]|nr:DUF4422 domain-containing protein [Alphaproteobacteria bacterium]
MHSEKEEKVNIRAQLEDCDCLVLKPYDVKHVNSGSIGEQYCKLPEQERATFDIFIKTVKRLYPEYMTGIEKIERGSIQYLCNMFVMKKELFFEYSEFCFAVLKEVDRQIDHNEMSTQGLRFLGYLGEFLLSIFIFNLKAKGGYRIKELNGSYILSDTPVLHPRLSYWGYWVLSKLTFGAIKKRYKQKRKALKQIRHIQNK